MNRLAELEALLKFYDKNLGARGGTGGSNANYSGVGVGGGGEVRPGLLWAQDMMGMAGHNPRSSAEDAPDFFGDEGGGAARNSLAAFVRPSMEGAGPMPARQDFASLDVPPTSIRRDTPMRGRANNMLANLMMRMR